jgi:hypothetical protein
MLGKNITGTDHEEIAEKISSLLAHPNTPSQIYNPLVEAISDLAAPLWSKGLPSPHKALDMDSTPFIQKVLELNAKQ